MVRVIGTSNWHKMAEAFILPAACWKLKTIQLYRRTSDIAESIRIEIVEKQVHVFFLQTDKSHVFKIVIYSYNSEDTIRKMVIFVVIVFCTLFETDTTGNCSFVIFHYNGMYFKVQCSFN